MAGRRGWELWQYKRAAVRTHCEENDHQDKLHWQTTNIISEHGQSDSHYKRLVREAGAVNREDPSGKSKMRQCGFLKSEPKKMV